MISSKLTDSLHAFLSGDRPIVVLTGAGVSAESGIPTFRGTEGYWTVGSKVYQPQEIATNAMLRKSPRDVWRWYLYRRGVCLAAPVNRGHQALVELEGILGDRFFLLTQNVDGIHLRAGNSAPRTFEIHGNLDYMRCLDECSGKLIAMDRDLQLPSRDSDLSEANWQRLTCPECQGPTRPHVLLWDEMYNEAYYRFQSSLKVTDRAGLLVVVGTTFATNLPTQVLIRVASAEGRIVDINPHPHQYTSLIENLAEGYYLQHPGGEALPALVQAARDLTT